MGKASKATRGAAAASIRPVTGAIGFKVLHHIFGVNGATCDEAERGLDMKHQTCSARFNELREKGLIAESDSKRRTTSGRWAVVYTATAKGKAALDARYADAQPAPVLLKPITRTPMVRTPVAS